MTDRRAVAKQIMENYNPNDEFPTKNFQCSTTKNAVKQGEPPIDEFCAEACKRKEYNLQFMNTVLSNPANYNANVLNKAKWLKQLYIMFWSNPDYLAED
jgi:hypothetical protein